jgi:ribosomal protein S27E
MVQLQPTDRSSRTVAVPCPKCRHARARVPVKSRTVATLLCAKCSHSWLAEIRGLPAAAQDALRRR